MSQPPSLGRQPSLDAAGRDNDGHLTADQIGYQRREPIQWGGKVIRGYAEFERQFMNWVWSQACGLCTDLPPGMR
jgi:hypothetical protein